MTQGLLKYDPKKKKSCHMNKNKQMESEMLRPPDKIHLKLLYDIFSEPFLCVSNNFEFGILYILEA